MFLFLGKKRQTILTFVFEILFLKIFFFHLQFVWPFFCKEDVFNSIFFFNNKYNLICLSDYSNIYTEFTPPDFIPRRRSYDLNNLMMAVQAVKSKTMSRSRACDYFGVPRTTVYDWIAREKRERQNKLRESELIVIRKEPAILEIDQHLRNNPSVTVEQTRNDSSIESLRTEHSIEHIRIDPSTEHMTNDPSVELSRDTHLSANTDLIKHLLQEDEKTCKFEKRFK